MVEERSTLEKVTTKMGDGGQSVDFSGEARFKDDILFECLGDIDELNSYIGIIYTEESIADVFLPTIQRNLMKIMAMVATSPTDEKYKDLDKLINAHVRGLEEIEKLLANKIKLEDRFYLPGESKSLISAKFDYARTLARRAERSLVRFIRKKSYMVNTDLYVCQNYLNRLSDYLFLVARAS